MKFQKGMFLVLSCGFVGSVWGEGVVQSILGGAYPPVGKPAQEAMIRDLASLPMQSAQHDRGDTPWGKSPGDIIRFGSPPQGSGPGLRFRTQDFFYVYTDRGAPANHFAPSGWMGDHGDIHLNDASTEGPADGRHCLKFTYDAAGRQGSQWAGVFWQEPQGNWGNHKRGYNLTGMKRLTFWARGEQGNERIAQFKIGGIQGLYPDTDAASIGPLRLSREWRQYVIDLVDLDLSKISGGFSWSAGRYDNTGPITFYLDEIRFER